MIDFGRFKALTFDCYGTLIDWDSGISDVVRPWRLDMQSAVPPDAAAGIQRSEILHVAQSKHHDMISGRQFGLTTVWVNRRYGKRGTGATLAANAEPDLTVNSLAEIVVIHKSQSSVEADRATARSH